MNGLTVMQNNLCPYPVPTVKDIIKRIESAIYRIGKYQLITDVLERGTTPVNEMTRKVIQEFLFEIADAGKNRTAHKLKQFLNSMFEVIVDDYPELTNPVKKVVLSHYVVKKGRAFTKAEEKIVIDFCKTNPQFQGNSAILVLMYTGMRVGELPSVEYDGTFIKCVSEKTRKGHQEIIRKIPVSPMLKKFFRWLIGKKL